jgi:hypothetical protein
MTAPGWKQAIRPSLRGTCRSDHRPERRTIMSRAAASPTESIVWVDREGGMIVDPAIEEPTVVVIDRARDETDVALAARLAQQVEERDHVYVAGPEPERIGFEREFVALTHHPERLVDVEPARR